MDIKLKNYRPSTIWLCFFLGTSIMVFFIAIGILSIDEIQNFDMALLGTNIKNTQLFKECIGLKFDVLAEYLTDDLDYNGLDANDGFEAESDFLDPRSKMLLDGEGENLIYYAKDPKTNRMLTNSEDEISISSDGLISLPTGYDYYMLFDGKNFTAFASDDKVFASKKDGVPLNIDSIGSGYHATLLGNYMGTLDSPIAGAQILLIVKEDIVEIPQGNSHLYWVKRQGADAKKFVFSGLVMLCWGIGLFVFSMMKREYKREFDRKIARGTSRLYLELRLLILYGIILSMFVVWELNRYPDYLLFTAFSILAYFWFIYFLWLDLKVNGSHVFSKNIINWILKKYRNFEKKRPFQRALIIRAYLVIVVIILIMLSIGVALTMYYSYWDTWPIIPSAIISAVGIYVIYRYFKRYKGTLDDIGRVIDHTERIKNGDMSASLCIAPDADLYIMEENLNAVQEGLNTAIEKSLSSERMKVELITNISHDLKTPLTSIISYIDLLSKEEGLPAHVNDYINILDKKAYRLNVLIQDLFDLSKSVSGEMKFEREPIDLGKLIEQTLGDMQEQIKDSKLKFRVNIPERPVIIISDGKKLYRVFLNLITNTLKYSLAGSRVYIDLAVDNDKAIATIKNVASYEMDFNEEEIMERFVRGDKARTSEGSGLGLAIAESFTLSCGGDFDIKIDGDLFKAILTFNVEDPQEEGGIL